MNHKYIIVNASALCSSGGLIILQQFISEIPYDNNQYIVFIDRSVKIHQEKENIQIVHVNARSFLKRFVWDSFGLNNWVKKQNIIPSVAISLQNTGFRLTTKCPNYIYFHQPIPLYPYKWNLFKASERTLWFYKYIYPFFIKLFINTDTEIFVQQEFIKNGFVNRFKFNKGKVHEVFPNMATPLPKKTSEFQLNYEKLNLVYPAVSFIYKNQNILFHAFTLIDKQLNKQIAVYLTNTKDEFETLPNYKNIEVVFLGKIPHEEVIWLFNNVDALLFPSYIETLGLPLIEAASVGLPILAADLPYAREVLDNYSGVKYIDFQNATEWSKAIIEQTQFKNKRFECFKKKNNNSWNYFFKVINK